MDWVDAEGGRPARQDEDLEKMRLWNFSSCAQQLLLEDAGSKRLARGKAHVKSRPEPEGSSVDPEETYERHRVRIFNYFRRCGVPPYASEDLTQGVFVVLLETLRRFDPDRGTLDAFLFGIARNLRRAWGRTVSRGPAASEQAAIGGSSHEDVLAVREAIQRLPEEQREAIILREFHGYSYEVIAQLQGVALGTVRSRLARGRETLVKLLRAD
jgi:RNA polymerase sigma-70 factor (ECF subfamily)